MGWNTKRLQGGMGITSELQAWVIVTVTEHAMTHAAPSREEWKLRADRYKALS
jgi:hypothetical protein